MISAFHHDFVPHKTLINGKKYHPQPENKHAHTAHHRTAPSPATAPGTHRRSPPLRPPPHHHRQRRKTGANHALAAPGQTPNGHPARQNPFAGRPTQYFVVWVSTKHVTQH